MTISKASHGILSSLVALGTFACSSSTTTTDNPGDGGVTADGSVVKDGGSPSDSSANDAADANDVVDAAADADAAPPSTKGGLVYLSQTKTGITYGTSAGAAFYLAPAVVTGAACVTTTAGSCTVSECNGTDTIADAGAPPSAGDITITGGLIADAGIVLSPATDGTYAPVTGATQAWNGGETLSFKAAGSATGAPSFDGKTVVAPTDVTVTPALSYITPTNVSRTTDYAFTWNGGGTGDVVVTLSTVQSPKSVIIVCRAPVATKALTVPQAAVAKLLATSATQLGTISIQPINESAFVAGDYAIKLSASATTLVGSMTTN